MPHVLLLTAESLPHDDLDTALLADALTDRDVRVTVLRRPRISPNCSARAMHWFRPSSRPSARASDR